MALKKSIEKLHEAIGGEMDKFSDNSASWVRKEDNNFSVDFIFSGDGKKFESIKIAKKIWQVVDEKVIITIEEPKPVNK